jgi:hypothetical protein
MNRYPGDPVGSAHPANGRNRRDLAVRHGIGEGRQSTPSRPSAQGHASVLPTSAEETAISGRLARPSSPPVRRQSRKLLRCF